jgi:hypothetical protein
LPDEDDIKHKRTLGDSVKRAWRMERLSARRRLAVRLGVIALVLLVLVVLPGYIATQPTFVQRYPNLNPEYKTWSVSVHAQVPCQRCHISPQPAAQAFYAVRMLGEFYVSMVIPNRQPQLYPVPTNDACQSCHIDLRTVSPSGDLNIPHRAHVEVLKMQCVKCHVYLVHEASPEGKHTPRMATCLTCHNGNLAKNSCSTCHTNKAIPASHQAANWRIIHPQMQAKIDCKSCHAWTTNWCADCHSRRPRDHTVSWRTTHGAQVKLHRNCEACHQAAFCIRCHGALPMLNFNPALQLVK